MTTIISFREFFSAHKWKIMLAVLLFLALIAGVTAYDATLAPSVETGDQNGKRAVYVPTGANESNLDSLLRPYVSQGNNRLLLGKIRRRKIRKIHHNGRYEQLRPHEAAVHTSSRRRSQSAF